MIGLVYLMTESRSQQYNMFFSQINDIYDMSDNSNITEIFDIIKDRFVQPNCNIEDIIEEVRDMYEIEQGFADDINRLLTCVDERDDEFFNDDGLGDDSESDYNENESEMSNDTHVNVINPLRS